jgi:hypothetical protein
MKTSRSIMTYGIPCLIITNVRGPVIDWFTRDCMTLEIITATLLVSLTNCDLCGGRDADV